MCACFTFSISTNYNIILRVNERLSFRRKNARLLCKNGLFKRVSRFLTTNSFFLGRREWVRLCTFFTRTHKIVVLKVIEKQFCSGSNCPKYQHRAKKHTQGINASADHAIVFTFLWVMQVSVNAAIVHGGNGRVFRGSYYCAGTITDYYAQ